VEELSLSFMPGYLGSGSEIILNENLPMISEEIIDLNAAFDGSQILLGHLLGGIRSTARNIFWENNGTQSSTNDTLYEVWLVPNSTEKVSSYPISKSVFTIYPNPTSGKCRIEFSCTTNCDAELTVFDSNGKQVYFDKLGNFGAGKQSIENRWKLFEHPGTYVLQLKLDEKFIVQKLLVEP
jgi:hypothetical protein